MAKYINAKDLLDEAMSKSVEVKVINGDEVEEKLENAVTITDLMGIAEYLYPADVIKVIRCKDCKHYFIGNCMNTDVPIYADNGAEFMPDSDFYCSYAERKEEE